MNHVRRSVLLFVLAALAACAPEAGGGAGGATGSETPPLPPAGRAGSGGGSAGTGGSSEGGSGGSAGASGSGGVVVPPAPAPDAGSSNDAGPSATPMPPSGEPVPSPGCSGGAVVPGPGGVQTIMATGKSRRFIIRMPGGYDGKRPLPVMFAFHGAGGGAAGFETGAFGSLSRMTAERATRVFPEALTGTWSRDEKDDLLFFDAILEWMKPRVCFDTARIFATGHSSGAYFSHRLGCNRGKVIRAVASNSGGQRREYPLGPCDAPVAAWMSTGASDNPGHVMGTQWARDEWLKTNGCGADRPMPTAPSPCVAHPGCPKGFPVHYCQHPGGHGLPGFASGAIFQFLFNAGL
jgi:polyhydroxybutyrate depolymerase